MDAQIDTEAVGREVVVGRSIQLSPTALAAVSAEGVQISKSGGSFDIEGEGAEPLLKYQFPDGRVLYETCCAFRLCLSDGDRVIVDADIRSQFMGAT